MIVYVDTSALLKRVVLEPESEAVRATLTAHDAAGDLLTASSLAWLEASRALRRAKVAQVDAVVERALSGVAEHRLTTGLLDRARRVGPDELRSLDAVHLASAVSVGAQAMLTYDDRLARAARSVGMSVLSPS